MLNEKRWIILLIWVLMLVVACRPTTKNDLGAPFDADGSGVGFTAGSETNEDSNEPPPATLTIDGQEQAAGIGTYCWTFDNDSAVCADKIGIPTDPAPLPAETTFLAEFHLPLAENPDGVSLSIFPVVYEETIHTEQGGWRWWPVQSGGQYGLPPIQDPLIELTLTPGLYVFNLFTMWPAFGDVSYGFLVNVYDPLNPDAAAFAEDTGLSLEEADQRLAFQETIGSIQPLLMADLSDSFGGLWIEHEPVYRIVIALTEGDEETIRPYIDGADWAEFVEVRLVTYTLEELKAAQFAAGRAADGVNVSATTSVDIIHNRVELMVGNPDLFRDDLAEAGIDLPDPVVILPSLAGEPLPDTNQGVLLEATTADGRIIYLPKQAPTGVSMEALMEGTLLEVNGCLRLSDDSYSDGFLILWPYDADIRVAEERIEVLNGQGQVIGREGELLRAGGGAMESSLSVANLDELIPGMPIEGCPGPYWVAGEIETQEDQAIPDVYFEQFSSGGRVLAWFVNQSRPSPEREILSGELYLDDGDCLRIGQYLIIWPPGVFLREEPLRIFDSSVGEIAQVGDSIQLTGAEKGPGDYRYFDRKVGCDGPYWAVNQVSNVE